MLLGQGYRTTHGVVIKECRAMLELGEKSAPEPLRPPRMSLVVSWD
jgi:hypothetical protein